MSDHFIKQINDNGTAVIKLSRPDVLNSFNKAMSAEVKKALLVSKEDENTRAIYLTGEGRAFSAGQDLEEAVPGGDQPPGDLGELIKEGYNPIIRLIRGIEKPVVCGVNGVAAGAGANIALACDVVVAAKSAYFIQAFSKIGLIPDSGGTFFLPRLVGLPRATAMMMLAEKITAEEALKYGMIHKVFPDESLFEEGLALAKQLSKMPTKALGLTKKALNYSFENNLEEQLLLERELQIQAGNSYDYKEGVKAFLEKRKPIFNGK